MNQDQASEDEASFVRAEIDRLNKGYELAKGEFYRLAAENERLTRERDTRHRHAQSLERAIEPARDDARLGTKIEDGAKAKENVAQQPDDGWRVRGMRDLVEILDERLAEKPGTPTTSTSWSWTAFERGMRQRRVERLLALPLDRCYVCGAANDGFQRFGLWSDEACQRVDILLCNDCNRQRYHQRLDELRKKLRSTDRGFGVTALLLSPTIVPALVVVIVWLLVRNLWISKGTPQFSQLTEEEESWLVEGDPSPVSEDKLKSRLLYGTWNGMPKKD